MEGEGGLRGETVERLVAEEGDVKLRVLREETSKSQGEDEENDAKRADSSAIRFSDGVREQDGVLAHLYEPLHLPTDRSDPLQVKV